VRDGAPSRGGIDHRGECGGGGEHLRPRAVAEVAFGQGRQARRRAIHRGVEEGRDELDRLERLALVLELVRQVVESATGEGGSVVRVAREHQRAREQEGGSAALVGVVEQVVGLAEVLQGQRRVGVGPGGPELEQDRAAPLVRRRLLERAREVGDRAVGGAAPGRRAGGLLKHIDDPLVAAARHREQVGRHLVGGRPRPAQLGGRAGVHQLTVRRGELLVDGVAHQRVHEADRRLGMEDLGAAERGGGLRHLLLVQLRQRGHGREIRVVAEHRHRAHDVHRLVREPRQAQQHRSRHRPRSDVGHDVHVRRVRLHVVGRKRGEQLAEEQRVAAGDLRAGGAEALVRVVAQPGPDHLGDRRSAQRPRPHRTGSRVVADLGDQGRIGAGVGAPKRRAHERGHVLEAAYEVGGEAERGAVAPLEVIDREHERAIRGDVRGEPIKAVKSGEGGIRADAVRAQLDRLEDRSRRLGRTRKPTLTDLLVGE
jgi:hypothetical protein